MRYESIQIYSIQLSTLSHYCRKSPGGVLDQSLLSEPLTSPKDPQHPTKLPQVGVDVVTHAVTDPVLLATLDDRLNRTEVVIG